MAARWAAFQQCGDDHARLDARVDDFVERDAAQRVAFDDQAVFRCGYSFKTASSIVSGATAMVMSVVAVISSGKKRVSRSHPG